MIILLLSVLISLALILALVIIESQSPVGLAPVKVWRKKKK